MNLLKKVCDFETLKRIAKVLNASDQVKFAKWVPSETEHKDLMDLSFDMINRISGEL